MRLTNEQLRQLCIKEGWFTCGTCGQYDELFKMNLRHEPVERIALVISFCSSGTTPQEVEETIENEMERLREVELPVTNAELEMIYNAVCRLNQDIDCGGYEYDTEEEEACRRAEQKIRALMF